VREQEQVIAFAIVQLERVGDAEKKSLRYLDIAPLLEPGVPRQANARERRDFFSAQSRSTSAIGSGQPYIRWSQFPPMVQ
jgi:hypothetical protein